MFERSAGFTLGLDIGGANIKLYHTVGHSQSVAFPMWTKPTELANQLIGLAAPLPPCQTWGVTMTGEMADVFADRSEGVQTIVEQTRQAAKSLLVNDVRFYAIQSGQRSTGTPEEGVTVCGNRFISAVEATAAPASVASANWHALASWVSTWIDRPSLVVDIGSTTVDLIPVSPQRVDTDSRTDFDRLSRGELVYVGIGRTPICSLVDRLPFDDSLIPIMRERFANTDDCAMLLNLVAEQPDDTDSCDSRPRTQEAATRRLARMIGLDHHAVSRANANKMADYVMQAVTSIIQKALDRHSEHAASQWVVTGHGGRLIEPPAGTSKIDLAARWDEDVSRVAPAYAICELLALDSLRREQAG